MIERALSVLLLIVILSVSPLRHAVFPLVSRKTLSMTGARNVFGDILKGVAILSVIIIHIGYVYALAGASAPSPFMLSVVNNILRFALPMFFILSGIFLTLPSYHPQDLVSFYWKKIVRIFIPFVLSTIAIGVAANLSLSEIGKLLITGNALVPYYFIIILFQLYLLYPFLLPFRKNRLSLVIVFLLSFISYLFLPIEIGGVPFAGRFVFLFFYGMYIRDRFLSDTRPDVYAWLGVVILYIFFMLSSFVIMGEPQTFFNARFFFGLAIFHILWFAKEAMFREGWLARLLQRFGEQSLWIYLLHYFFLVFFYRLGAWIDIPSIVLYFILLLAVPAGSYLLARITHMLYTTSSTLLYVSKKE